MSILEWVKLLWDLNENELSNLEVFCQERFISKWELLFKEWDDANSMYLLSKWELEIITHKDNKEIILGYIEAEDVVWEMALFWDRSKRMASARATKDTLVIILLEFSISELTKKHPEVLEKIKKIIDNRKQENKKVI